MTAVGRDELGKRILAFLKDEGLPGARIHPSLPTGTVQVALEAGGVPRFTIATGCAWTDIGGAPPAPAQGSAQPSVLVFGGVAMHSPGNQRLLEALWPGGAGPATLRLCDLNLRPGWSDPAVVRWCLDHAEVLKVNQEELAFLLALEGLEGESELLARFALRALCVTLGADGLSWRDQAGRTWQVPAQRSPVVDTVGAGDAVTAALALGLASGQAPEVFLEQGGLWAAQTCAVRGALRPRAI